MKRTPKIPIGKIKKISGGKVDNFPGGKILAGLALLLGMILLGGLELGGSHEQSRSGTSETAAEATLTGARSSPRDWPDERAGADLNLGLLQVYFFDVGQGDCTLLAGPDFTVVVDAGRHDQRDVVPLLRQAGVRSIDLLIGTHPHSDHIGQIPDVLAEFSVQEVWMCGEQTNTVVFRRAIDAIMQSEAGYHEPRAGEAYQLGSAHLQVLHPTQLRGDLNDSSIAIRLTFGHLGFVITGDAEARAEREMIQRGAPLAAQVLRLGHHGSSTSSIPEFLRAVAPEVAIYSAGKGNRYGHPHDEIIQRVNNFGIQLLGTDRHGTIRVTTDGWRYEVETASGIYLASPQSEELIMR